MNTREFLLRLQRENVKLWAEGEALRYKSMQGALEPEDLAELRERKGEILALIRQAASQKQADDPIEPAPRDPAPPLSFAQRRLWFLDQMGAGTAYNLPWAFVIEGELDTDALTAAINAVVARHEVLRTRLPSVDGKPVQDILPPPPLLLRRIDLSDREEARRRSALRRVHEEEAVRPFDLAMEIPIRPTLVRMGTREHVLILSIHHVAFDGWSFGVFMREMLEIYRAITSGEEPKLPDLPIQYADYAYWQRQRLQGEALQRQLDYWREKLGHSTPTELPTDRPRPAMQTFVGASHRFSLPTELTAALQRLSRSEGATLTMTLLAALKILLSRYTGQEDIVVGSPIANRNHPDIESLIGFFVNSIALRTDLSGDPTFVELLRRVQETSLGSYEHQDVPFELLVDELEVERDLSRSPIFQVAFTMQNAPGETSQMPGLQIRPVSRNNKSVRFDLELEVVEHAGRVVGSFLYNTDLFDHSTIERFAAHFVTLLESVAADPSRRISRFSMLDEEERGGLLAGVGSAESASDVEAVEPWCIHERFEAQVARFPDATAVVFGDRHLTYGELNEHANRLAHRLRALGAGPDVLVGLAADRGLELVVGVLGILKAGSAYVPLDPAYPSERLAFMIDDAQMPLILAQPHLVETLPRGSALVVPMDPADAAIASEPSTNPERVATPEDLAYVIYTSGSTGQPKGVLVEHRQVSRLFTSTDRWFGFDDRDVWTLFHSCAFDFSVWELWGALLYGGRLVVVPYEVSRTPEEFHELVVREGVTVLNQTPSAFRQFMRVDEGSGEPDLSLRLVIFGGEALELQSLRPWFERHDDESPELVNMYGITETTVHVTYRPIRRGDLEKAPGSVIGTPIPDLRVHILDAHGEPVPTGVPGEMYVGGAGVTRGYLARPELTAARFVPAPFDPEGDGRLYRTGDVARVLGNGDIVYLGRNDEQVKIRGFRIELGEIEATLVRHPNVREAIVLAREDDPGVKRLVAYVVGDSDDGVLRGELREFVSERLPSHMVPAAIVPLDTLPLTANGKVDRAALPAPDPGERRVGQAYVVPRTPEERTLADIWAALLRVERVGVDDNFFELGGDSILSIQIISRAREAGLHLTARDVFRHQTISELAAAAQHEETTSLAPEAATVIGDVPLAPIHHWFFAQDRVDPHHYNQALIFSVDERLDPEVWRSAFAAVLEHHDALRARFRRENGAWRQTIDEPGGSAPFTVVDLSTLSEAEQRSAVREQAAALQASLDLSDGPIVRATLFDLGLDHPSQLLIIIHHVSVDAVSWGILRDDLQRAAEQLGRGEPVRLPAKTVSVRQWATYLQELAETPALVEQLPFWARLEGTRAADVPLDGDPSDNTVVSAAQCIAALTEAETRSLIHEVPRAYGTQMVDVLLTALARAFAPWTGRSGLLVDLEGHGREVPFGDVDVSRTVGWFTSIHPVLIDAGVPDHDADDLGASIKQVKEQLRAVPDRGLGYGVLHTLNSSPEVVSALSRVPTAPVLFNYMGQFNRGIDSRALLRSSGVDAGPAHSPRSRRSHLIEINGGVAGDRLSMSFTYGSAVHEAETIKKLADRFVEELRAIIKHCALPDSGGSTPSDFPLADVDQARIDALSAAYGARAIEAVYPLSPMQQGMMFHTLRDPLVGVYVEQMRFHIDGLDAGTFKRAWGRVMKRHSALRIAIVEAESDVPLQIVLRDVLLPVFEHDLSDLTADEQRAWVDAYCLEDQDRGFDLSVAPLFRLALLRLGEERYEFVWTFHHIVLDGWSFARVINEVLTIYDALLRADEPPLPRPRPYQDYFAWLREQSEEEARAYWRRTLADVTEPTPIGLAGKGRTGPPRAGSYQRESRRLSERETQALQEFASGLQITVNTLVAGAWSLLLARASGVRDVVLGTVVSGRAPEIDGIESMVGMFVNTLPLRIPVVDDEPLGAWLHALQDRQIERRQYEYSALWDAQQASGLPPGVPLFESLYVFENYPVDVTAARKTRLRIGLQVSEERTGYPLTLTVGCVSSLAMQITYDPDRFDAPWVGSILDGLVSALAAFAADPEQRVGRISLLSESARHRVLDEWNDTAAQYARDASIHELFETQTAQTPDAIAVEFEGELLTYLELNRRANQLAHHLIGLGVGPEVKVGIAVERSVEMVVGILGVLKAGGAYVPLDPGYPPARLAFMMQDTKSPVVLTQAHLESELPEHDGTVLRLDADWSVFAAEPETNPGVSATATSVAYVIYTSGSTGRPKGVCVPHRAISRLVLETDYVSLGPADRVAHVSNVSFDAATFEIWGALLNGGSLVGIDRDVAIDPTRLAAALRDQHISVIFVTTALFNRFAEVEGIFSSLRCVLFGGEAVDPARVRAVLAHGAPERLLHVYGPTENTTFSTWHEVHAVAADATTVPIGRPIANTTAYVLDAAMNPVPIGVPGELYLGGDGLAQGYLNRPELTAERFVSDPFSGIGGSRLYRTGDLVRYRADGDIEFLGRVDFQMKVRGFRIEPGEIETALLETDEVREAVVVCRADKSGEKQLVAYVAGAADCPPSRSKLRDCLRDRVPSHMIPSTIVVLESMPLTPNGKVDRQALPAPEDERQVEDGYVAPRSELEREIAGIWRAVLEVETVGVHDNFFDSGGHSLRLLRVHGRLKERGHEISITELFEYPTIAALAARLGGSAVPDHAQRSVAARAGRRNVTEDSAIAIIGLAGRFPGAPDLDIFWHNLREGVEAIRPLADDELRAAGVSDALIQHPNYVKVRSGLDDIDLFDATFFGYTPREAELIDPQQRAFLECAWQALERAGYDAQRYDGMIGVYAGTSVNTYVENIRSRPDLAAASGWLQVFISSDKDFLPTRVSYKLNLRGPSVTVQTACSTSLVAVHEACRSLLDGQCNVALAGGVSIGPTVGGYMYHEGGIFSPDGHCRTFDARAQGTLSGHGVGVVALKRLAEAQRDGDVIQAVIRGTAINNDGSNKVGYTAPSVEGQADVIATAQAVAGIDPATVTYVEAHGTATPLGDPIEMAALTRAFRERTEEKGYCAIGSLKTNIGHLDAAAGVAGLIKTVLALQHEEIPPSLHFESPNPEIDFENSPFFVNTTRRPWVRANGVPRRAGVSSFGLGGTNAHAVLEEAPELAPSDPCDRPQLLVLSAKTETAIETATANLAAHLREDPAANLADVAYTLQLGRQAFDYRRAVTCSTVKQAVDALDGNVPSAVQIGCATRAGRSVVFVFPGQGAQYVGMGQDLYRAESAFRDAMDRCFAYLDRELSLDLRSVLYPTGEIDEVASERLTSTSMAQPALFAVEYALAQMWRAWGIEPLACIGHSIGEFTAACVSGVLELEDALRLVTIRGRLMADQPAGVMTAVPLPEQQVVHEWLNGAAELWLSAVNGPSLCVVSGTSDRVEAFEAKLAEGGVECRRLHTSHAFHSGMMDGAVAPFVDAVRNTPIARPSVPYASNVTGDWITKEDVRDPAYWGRHIRETVRFSAGMARLLDDPDCALLEVGPGRVLGTLARQQPACGAERVVVPSMRPPRSTGDDREVLLSALGRLWTGGVDVDWPRLHGDAWRRRVILPTYPFERERYWIDRATSPPSAGAGALARRADLADWFYAPSWRRTMTPAAGDLTEQRLVIADGSPFAARVIERLQAHGCHLVVATSGEGFARDGDQYVIDPASRDDYRRLLTELAEGGRSPRHVVHLLGLAPLPNRGDDDVARACVDRLFHGPIAFVQAIDDAGMTGPIRLDFVTAGVHDASADDEVCPEKALILGPARVIGREFPDITCRQVDMATREIDGDEEVLAERLAQEVLSSSADAVVAHRREGRLVESLVPTRVEALEAEQPTRLRAGATYLITGGLGGIGLELGRYLVRAVSANLVLTSRTPLPDRAAWSDYLETHDDDDPLSIRIRAVEALEHLGAQVMVAEADVADLARMQAVIDEAGARLGPVRGIIHAAGVAGEGVILLKQREQAERVLAPKVWGARVLERLCQGRELDFVVLCSSLASAVGIAGQVDYCAANAYLDAFARRFAVDTATFTVSIGWNRWRESGMAVDYARRRGLKGELEGSSNQEGVELFRRILAWWNEPCVVVAERDPFEMFASKANRAGMEDADATEKAETPEREAAHARPNLPTAYVAPRTAAEKTLVRIWGDLLGIASLGVHDNFFDLGGHSLLATQVMARVREALRVEAPIKAVFDAPTVAELAEALGGGEATDAGTGATASEMTTIIPRRREGASALSLSQERFWILDRIEPGLTAYNNVSAYCIEGTLDEAAFNEGLCEIVRRHEILRTTFTQHDGKPVQIIHEAPGLKVLREDLAVIDESDRRAALNQRIGALVQAPFDLERGPLLRPALFRLGERETVFVLVMHHIISDAWSLEILKRELSALYEALRSGRPATLDPPSLQYVDYAAWQREWFRGEVLEDQLAFWRDRLAGAPPVLELPIDRPRPPIPTYRGAITAFEFSEALSESVNDLANRSNASPFMVLLALFNVLLSRWSGATDIVIGTPIAGRRHEEVEQLIGLFINTLVLRTQLSDEPSFRGVMERVREHTLAAFDHQDLPFDRLVDELQPERRTDINPLYQVMFMVQNTRTDPFALADLKVRGFPVAYDLSPNDLTLAMAQVAGRWCGQITYSTDLFDEQTIDRMIAACRTLAEGLLADPDRPITAAPLIDESERRKLIVEWNDTDRAYPRDRCAHDLFEVQAARTPDAVALQCETKQLTYGELNRRANQIAHRLRAIGVGVDATVALCVEPSDLVVGALGAMKAGAAYVPLDPTYPPDRLAYMVDGCRAVALLTQERLLDRLPSTCTTTIAIDADPTLASEPTANPPLVSEPGRLAYVIYTSGSTGRPKGVAVSHEALANLIGWHQREYAVTSEDRAMQIASIGFDACVWEMWPYLTAGASVHIPRHVARTDPDALWSWMKDRRITIAFLPTPLAEAALARPLPPGLSLRALLTGGDRLQRSLDGSLPFEFVNHYGPTENTVVTTCGRVAALSPPPIGRPIDNVRTYILDRNMNPVPVGVPGELYIGGSSLARGYLHQREMTAERFLPDPFGGEPGSRLYRTGDVARYLNDGAIDFVGRVDHQVKVRGFRIELGEIEATLTEHPSVRGAIVLCREDAPGEKQLVAYVVTELDAESLSRELRRYMAEKLPGYMIPPALVLLEAFPLSPNGKIDRSALPAPQQEQRSYVAPRGDVEARIVAVWREVLGVDTIGVRDNFFELGGHSLKLIQVHTKLTETLGGELSVLDLFAHPTVELLAKRIVGEVVTRPLQRVAQERVRRRSGTEDGAIAVVGLAGRFPDTPDVETFWSNLRSGVELIRFFSDDELREAGVDEALLSHPNYVKARAVLEGADLFDAWFFGYNPREAELIDPQQRIFLECAWEAIERAGYDPDRFDGLIGVYAGSSQNTYAANVRSRPDLLASAAGVQGQINSAPDHLPTRVSYKLNLRGPSMNVQTACSTSLVAVHEACRSLLEHRCDMALAGGVSVFVPMVGGYLYQEGSIASPDGHCRAFDARACGTLGGSGVGIAVLKRLEDAIRDGDQIHAVIRGTATNNDGAQKVGYTAPSIEGQAEVIATAQAFAGVTPETITYVEAHGTGTELGDPIEVEALTRVFHERTEKRGFCALGSLKTNMGHLDAAAGVAGLIKTVLALEHKEIPPSLHYETPNPKIDFENSPFYVNTELRAWASEDGHPRRAGVSSFGIGGTNAHVVLEEAPSLEPSGPARPWQLLVLSAKSESALQQATRNLTTHLREHDEVNLADVAFTLQVGRREFEHRRAVVARDATDTANALEGSVPNAVMAGRAATSTRGVVFMFPGQGAQYVNMGLGLYRDEPVFRDTVDQCIRWLDAEMGLDLRAVLYPPDGPSEKAAERLKRTSIAQPALFVVEYALAQLWRSWGVEPVACIGHSIGEFAAACIAGVLTLEDALRLVTIRGWLMEEMPIGVMSAVPLPADRVRELLEAEPDLWLAAVNGPWLSVVSGAEARVAALESKLAADGVECRRLHTSHAFHSGLMEDAVAPFVEAVGRIPIGTPAIPYVSNVTGDWITEADVRDPQYWGRHVRQAVRFSEGMARLLENGDCVLLEVGPGRVLGTLARQQPACGPGCVVVPTLRPPKADTADGAFAMEALARLWTQGVGIDWSRFHEGEQRRRVILPTYPFERERYWVEPRRGAARHDGRLVKHGDIDRWFYVPVWKLARLADGTEGVADQDRVWLVFENSSKLIGALAERLDAGSNNVVRVVAGDQFVELGPRRYAIDPREPGDYRRLLDEVAVATVQSCDAVHGWSLPSGAEARGRDEIIADGLESVLFLVQALAARDVQGRVTILTEGANDVTGDEPLCPATAAVHGLARVVPQEHPALTCRTIDVPRKKRKRALARIAQLVADELCAGVAETAVAYRAGRRWVQTYDALEVDTGGAQNARGISPVREGGVYLITGGLGHVGLEMAEALARAAKVKLVLTGRSAFPDVEAWEHWVDEHGEDDRVAGIITRLRAIEALGNEVLTAQADVADAAAMRDVLASIDERFGDLHGVVHAAGVVTGPSMDLIAALTRDACAAQLRPKLDGLLVLDKLLAGRSLDFRMVTSSLSAVLGGLGMAAYAAANACLDVFAYQSLRGKAPWLSVDWDGWRFEGESGAAAGTEAARGMAQLAMRPDEGAEAFLRLLRVRGVPQVVVSTGDLDVRLDQWVRRVQHSKREGDRAEESSLDFHARPTLPTEYVAPSSSAQLAITGIWQQMLGVEPIGVHDDFFDLGGHSLLATQVLSRVRDAFDVQLALADLFDAPTVTALATLIEAKVLGEMTEGDNGTTRE